MSLGRVLAAATPAPGGFRAEVPTSWHQGRTAFGGFSTALALQAALNAGGELPPLRSAQVSFIGPVAGEAEVSARVLRRGRNATWIGTEIRSGGAIAHTASFLFMGPVASSLHLNRVAGPGPVDAPEAAREARKGSAFMEHFDSRYAGPPPDGEGAPEIVRWIRMIDRAGLDPMVELLCLADVLPAGYMRLVPPGTPLSSMTWQCNLLTPQPRTDDGWWLLRSLGSFAEHGCSTQDMTLWNAAGEPVATGMQSVAIFG